MSVLADATLFPIPPNAEFPVTLSRAWLTDVQRTQSGKEVRQAIRSRAARRLEYTASLYRVRRLEGFRNLWLAAAELLRFLVPLWPEYTIATAFPDSTTITADTTFRDFVDGEQALLWRNQQDAETYELVTIATLTDGGITTEDPISGAWATYPAGSVRLIPVIGAWLVPPTKEQLMPTAADVPLVFDEELPGVAGIDPTVGDAVTPPGATISLELEGDSGYAGLRYFTLTALVKDTSGQPISEPNIVWTVVATGTMPVTDPGFRDSFPMNGQQCHVEYEGDADVSFLVTATYGAISANRPIGG